MLAASDELVVFALLACDAVRARGGVFVCFALPKHKYSELFQKKFFFDFLAIFFRFTRPNNKKRATYEHRPVRARVS